MTNVHAENFAAKAMNTNVLKLVAIALAVVFGVLYVVQMNDAVMKTYTMRDLQDESRELTRENDRLSGEVDRLRSLTSINERQAFLGMVEPVKVEYIKMTSGDIALR